MAFSRPTLHLYAELRLGFGIDEKPEVPDNKYEHKKTAIVSCIVISYSAVHIRAKIQNYMALKRDIQV